MRVEMQVNHDESNQFEDMKRFNKMIKKCISENPGLELLVIPARFLLRTAVRFKMKKSWILELIADRKSLGRSFK